MKDLLKDLNDGVGRALLDAMPYILFTALLVLIGNGTIPS